LLTDKIKTAKAKKDGRFNINLQKILIYNPKSLPKLAKILVHELLHMNKFTSLNKNMPNQLDYVRQSEIVIYTQKKQ